MKSETLIPFSFETHSVRTVMIDGEIWFVAQDIMDALDYAKASNPARVMAHIPEEWIKVNPIHSNRGRPALLISEHGLYFFLGRSDKPKALPFQKWLAGEVLPSIRKTGSYSANPELQLSKEDLNSILGVCAHMRMFCGWWYQYGDAIRVLNRRVAASVHDHFADGSWYASSLISKLNLKVDSHEFARSYPFDKGFHDQHQYYLVNKHN